MNIKKKITEEQLLNLRELILINAESAPSIKVTVLSFHDLYEAFIKSVT